MISLRFKDTRGQTLTFRGTKICSEESSPVKTVQGAVGYQLEVYDRDNGEWVLKIIAERREEDFCEILEFCSSDQLGTIEDFLYDFDPARILPRRVLDNPGAPANQSQIDAADRAYHAVVRRVFHQVSNRSKRKRVLETRHHYVRQTEAILKVDTPTRGGIFNRIKRLFRFA